MRKLFGLVCALSLFVPALSTAGEEKNIVQTAAGAPQFKTLVAAVKAADLAEALSGEGPFTVLAPTDEAFAKLPTGTVENLLKPENKAKLAAILKYHVIPAKALAGDVVKLNGKSVKTLEGATVPIKVLGKTVMVGNAKVLKTDILCTNGVIHVIDTVLIPPAE